MKRSFNDNSADKQRLERAMKGVAQQLAAMAPSPDRKNASGPCFVKQDPRVGTGSDTDGMLGAMILDSLCGLGLGSAFADAINAPEAFQQVDWGNAIDIYDEYSSDRASSNFTLGQKNSINHTFNNFSAMAEKAFQNSLPKRMKLEQTYAHLSRELDQYNSPAAPSIAA